MKQVSRREVVGAATTLVVGLGVIGASQAQTDDSKAIGSSGGSGPQVGRVTTEGDELYFETYGNGKPLLMISGGNGDAGFYSLVAPLLADEFQVICYDRRGNSRSSRNAPQNPEMSQQARDAVAVLRAAGHSSALVFGNSGGALVALELARRHPSVVRGMVVHEPPALRVLPDANEWLAFYAEVFIKALKEGWLKAQQHFYSALALPPDLYKHIPSDFSERLQRYGNAEFMITRELMPLASYEPDIEAIRANAVKLVMAAGKQSLEANAHYARTAPILAERLGCEMVVMPGHHNSYFDTPEEWSQSLREILRRFT
ncbi:MAG TPA: alpha/beta hydrolase [Steroidobacter sp.]